MYIWETLGWFFQVICVGPIWLYAKFEIFTLEKIVNIFTNYQIEENGMFIENKIKNADGNKYITVEH